MKKDSAEAVRLLQSQNAKLKNANQQLEAKQITLEGEVEELKQKKESLKKFTTDVINAMTKEERVAEIEKLIDKNDITEFYQLVKFVSNKSRKNYSVELKSTVISYSTYFDLYIKSRKRVKKKGTDKKV